jgi:hypothetical protein
MMFGFSVAAVALPAINPIMDKAVMATRADSFRLFFMIEPTPLCLVLMSA